MREDGSNRAMRPAAAPAMTTWVLDPCDLVRDTRSVFARTSYLILQMMIIRVARHTSGEFGTESVLQRNMIVDGGW